MVDDPKANQFSKETLSKREKFLKAQAADPILASSSEEEEAKNDSDDESGTGGESSEDDVDFEFPRDDTQALL